MKRFLIVIYKAIRAFVVSFMVLSLIAVAWTLIKENSNLPKKPKRELTEKEKLEQVEVRARQEIYNSTISTYLKPKLKDPDSLLISMGDSALVKYKRVTFRYALVTYRSKNSFGGYVATTKYFLCRFGQVRYVLDPAEFSIKP